MINIVYVLKRCWNGTLNESATKDLQKKYRNCHESNDKKHGNDNERVRINVKNFKDESHDLPQECNNQERN